MPVMRRARGSFLLRVALSLVLLFAVACTSAPAPILLLVSLDGWRADYSARVPTPHLDALARRGVRAEWLVPVFPSTTFPNHYTIVTGLYPEHHGIVSNEMEDPAIGERFTLSAPTALDPRWWSGEPLWNTAGRQGRRSASMFWPGSEVPIQGQRPTYWFPYKEDMPNADRVKQVLDWLALPEGQRPAFVTLYFSDVDTAGHRYGPDSPQVAAAAARLDALLGDVVSGIERLGLTSRTTIAVVSDHGMAQLDPSRVIFADDYLDLSTVDVVEWSPVLALRPRRGGDDVVVDALAGRHPALHVYRREEMPERFHYRSHPRIPPILALADDGWTISSHARFDRQRARGVPLGGTHGFDPESPSMRALFVAAGPRLRRGAVVPPLANVHLYDFFCGVLGIDPAPNDGDPAATRALFER
jgi:predicted AlkP superfamily pyrophosphatase or phosphodiesterase